MESIVGVTDFFKQANISYFDKNASIIDIIQAIIASPHSSLRINGEYGTFIVDLSSVSDKYNEWIKHLPRVKPFYAVKSNPDPMILKVLSILGAGFDCASESEMQSVVPLCNPVDIIYANPAKFDGHLRAARALDVDKVTLDNKFELLKIAHTHPGASLVFRIKVDDSNSACKLNEKFGVPVENIGELITYTSHLKESTNKDIKILGVSFHVGSNCGTPQSFDLAIGQCRKVFDLSKSMGHEMTFLDIGGGFPGVDEEGKPSFIDFATQINLSIDKHFGDLPDITIIAEPGRYFCSASHTLVLNIVAKNQYIDSDGNVRFTYTVNDGVYGSLNCIIFDHARPIIKPFNERSGKTYRCTVYGPTCDSVDIITDNCMLPDLAIGECVYIENIGAYSSAAASQFNGFKRTPSEYVMRR